MFTSASRSSASLKITAARLRNVRRPAATSHRRFAVLGGRKTASFRSLFGHPSLVSPSARRLLASGAARAAGGEDFSNPSELQEVLDAGGRLTHAAHVTWKQLLRPGNTVVDATCGNGHDTEFLAQQVGPTGCVYGFDIQEAAVASTTRRINESIPAEQRPRVHLVRGCHSKMASYVGEGEAKLVCFNLGYLPSADKSITTRSESTVTAIKAASKVVSRGGAISIMCYTGHPGGMDEYAAVVDLIQGLSTREWIASEHRILNRPSAPILQLLFRRSEI